MRDDRGSATVPAVAFLGVLLLLGAALGAVAGLVVAHRSAQSAADLAALAAASAVADGDDGCAAAGSVADANGGELTRCALTGREARVVVRVVGPHWLGLDADPEAEARAGPG
jgi:secretion/DNA translocation related TadE-like protein